MTKVIGLTGGIATGKSTVSSYLKKKGYFIVDADMIAHDALMKGKKPYELVCAHFPSVVEEGEINRRALGKIVFHDQKEKDILESYVLPYVREEIEKEIEKHEEVILDVPLLFEKQYDILCDFIIVVSCSYEIQLKRLMERNHFSKEEAHARIMSQMSLAEKEKRADYIIHNDGNLEELYKQVDDVIREVKHAF